MNKANIDEAVKFHGHLGPWLVLGLAMGELALKELAANKYFGVEVKVFGAVEKPKSCLIDGLQLSTGATYGKGNITKFEADQVKVEAVNKETKTSVSMEPADAILNRIMGAKTHAQAEALADEMSTMDALKLFTIRRIK